MPRVVHFEFAAQDPEKTAEFYRKALGWVIQKWDGPAEYWLVSTGAEGERGIDGGILRRQDGAPRTVATVGVDSVDEAVQQVVRSGGQVMVPKMAIPGVGYQAYCTDPEGNVFGLHEPNPSAK